MNLKYIFPRALLLCFGVYVSVSLGSISSIDTAATVVVPAVHTHGTGASPLLLREFADEAVHRLKFKPDAEKTAGAADNDRTPNPRFAEVFAEAKAKMQAREPFGVITVERPPPPAVTVNLFTNVHCVCGPEGVSAEENGCVPVVENAIANVYPKVNVTFESFLPPNSDAEASLNALIISFNECRAKSYFPLSPHTFLFVKSTSSLPYLEACSAIGPSHGPDPEIFFHVVRWNNWVPFHNLFDHGLFQVWMGFVTVKKFLEENLQRKVAAQPSLHIVDDLSGWWFSDQTKNPAVHEIWLSLLNPRTFLHQSRTRSCHGFYVVGDLRASTSGYMRKGHGHPSPALLGFLRQMSFIVNGELTKKYGPIPKSTTHPVLYEDRQVTNSFDAEHRSRGIQPHLRNELRDMLRPVVGQSVARQFDHNVPLGIQYKWIQSSSVILTSEGSFMAFMLLSAPNTTWICVYNHTRPTNEWMYSNWHAPGAMAFNWIRVIFYVIDHGEREPMSALEKFFVEPFQPGVFYVGNIDPAGVRVEKH